MSEKTKAELLKEELFYKNDNGLMTKSQEEIKKSFDFCDDYKRFLDVAKTEREAALEVIARAQNEGFEPFDKNKQYKAGDKFYVNNRDKSVILCVMGKKPLSEGVRIAAAHIDSPRIDLKPNPLYEADELALFKTHYYGGIKKYQWTCVPLSLHGVIIKADGQKVTVKIGEDENDPQFIITDLLPHLAREQSQRKLGEGITGEELNILIGSMPFEDDQASESVKLNIMKILNEKYGIIEEDFLSAELELVPSAKAKDIGFDRSLIGAYGHDDRVCAYPEMIAAFETKNPEKTTVTIFADKEETGSEGNTGLNSNFLEYFIGHLAQNQSTDGATVLQNSQCLSADVNAAYDPTFANVFEKKNSSFINHGAVVTKYTGGRGKSSTSDATAEFMGEVRAFLNKAEVTWQTGELGKVDEGGGGTVAMYIANLGVDVVDLGVPVLSMHAPYEVVSKYDVYSCYRAVKAFFELD